MENILEFFIPLIIVIAYVFPKLFGKKAGTATGQKNKKSKSGVFDKLNEMFKEYYENEVKEAQHQNGEDEDPWPPVVQEDEQPEPSKYQEDPAVMSSKPEPSSSTLETSENPQTSANEQIDVDQRQKIMFDSKISDSSDFLKKPDKMDLRRAIVWSEILSPPKALRDE